MLRVLMESLPMNLFDELTSTDRKQVGRLKPYGARQRAP